MPNVYVIGAADGFNLAVDFKRQRLIVRANTQMDFGAPKGVRLEPLDPGPNGFFPAMVLVHREWRHQYFMLEREGWTEGDYFRQASWLMREKGISRP